MPEQTEQEFYDEGGKRWFKTGDIGQVSIWQCSSFIISKILVIPIEFSQQNIALLGAW
jgi:uncharacterized membrane protein